MQDILSESLEMMRMLRARRMRTMSILLILSLLVSLNVFFAMRQPGLTLAGDADCGFVEHLHDELCPENCEIPEHTHSLGCYSDDTADVETAIDWQARFKDYPFTGDLRRDLVGIAQTQVGYRESEQNFFVGDDGIRHGYTRYGAWYGAPYADWSALFVSYCLHYAGADPNEYPANTGAGAMATAWEKLGKYAPFGVYTPSPGDLVFFKDNTVGIVVLVNKGTFRVIRGDIEGAVTGQLLNLNDETITGWGVTAKIEAPQPPQSELLDISQGPAVFIFVGKETEEIPMTFALRSTPGAKDLLAYLETKGGTYFYTLLDKNNQELPKDAGGNYIAEASTGYKLTLTITNPEGFLPGIYEYQIPNGLLVDGGEGSFILKDGTNVGSWTVTDEGLITLNFNDKMNSRTDITISATMGIHFPVQEDPIDFDGKITVTVEKPAVEIPKAQISKWGMQGNEYTAGKTDETKIYWTAYLIGAEGTKIPGSTITDKTLWDTYLGAHSYTQSDMDAGLNIGVSVLDPVTGAAIDWHAWMVYPGDPNLTWTADGWSYKVPETAVCQWCGQIPLGNVGYEYYINYSSTPAPSSATGALAYMNNIKVDNVQTDGWAEFTHGEIFGEITKTGDFVADASGGHFQWEFQAVIPGRVPGEKATYYWYIMDYMDIRSDKGNLLDYITNDANRVNATATVNGVTTPVPHIQYAPLSAEFAWNNAWSPDHGDGIYYGRELDLLCRCHCTEESCPFWNNGKCGSEYWFIADNGNWLTNGFCQCWTSTEVTVLTFTYRTDDMTVVDKFGGMGNLLRNEAALFNKIPLDNGGYGGIQVSNSVANVEIPGMFKKDLTQDFDGYTANYKITINEAKVTLTDGSPLFIRDEMTQTLAYISGSLIITAEDGEGRVTTLKQGTDYTVTYDGTGDQRGENGAPVHVLDIVIQNPQPVKYTLDYDTTLVIPPGTDAAVKYSNSANITLWGESMSDTSAEKVFADINIAAKSFRVEVAKISALTGDPLAGATFGLYNAEGGLITTEVTDDQGNLAFETSIVEGIILREHVLYYMQELRAPPGYALDSTKYWFCFCEYEGDYCATCNALMAGTNAFRIPSEQIGKVQVVNEMMHYDLPATGGTGTLPLILVGVALITTSLVYGYIRRRKREGRGVG